MLSAGTYRPILHTTSEHVNADGSLDATTKVSDWIPLLGTVTAGGPLSCAVLTHS
jgi:hypothetical protein